MTWPHAFSRAWRRLLVFASNSDWFIALFTCVVIGQSNYFGFLVSVLRHTIENRSTTLFISYKKTRANENQTVHALIARVSPFKC